MQKPSQRMQWLLALGFLDLNALEDLKMEKKFKFLKIIFNKVVKEKCGFLNKKIKILAIKCKNNYLAF